MPTWDHIFKNKGKYFHEPHEFMRSLVDIFMKNKVKRILDLGCGTGRHVVFLAKAGFDVYGTDVSKEGLRLARIWIKEAGLDAKLKLASCYEKFPFEENFFDAIISTQVIHHNKRDNVNFCISEIVRTLKPGGFIFLTVPSNFSAKRQPKLRPKSKKIAPHTYLPIEGEEKGVIHLIYNKKLLLQDLMGFDIINIFQDKTMHYCVLARNNK